MRVNFEIELEELKEHIQEMGVYIQENYDALFEAIAQGNEDRLYELKKSDRLMKDMEHQIESKCLSLLTRQQPVARDLRRVSAALKCVTDMERIGDHIADIAELMLRVENKNLKDYSKALLSMGLATGKSIREGVQAFVKRDVELAMQVIAADDVIDDYFNEVKMDLVQMMKREQLSVDACVDIMMLNKYLEKIGDHTVNIAEWEIFQETGNMEDVRLL